MNLLGLDEINALIRDHEKQRGMEHPIENATWVVLTISGFHENFRNANDL